jgi:DNA-binding response OmpR family regulator
MMSGLRGCPKPAKRGDAMTLSKILVVDDDQNIRNSVRLCLEAEGYSIGQAVNGADALEQIHRNYPDLVLLDLAMPGIDGMTVLAELRTLWAKHPTRVIVITAHGSVKTAIEAMRLGASDFLEKPFVPENLRRSVASVLHDSPPHLDGRDGDYAHTLQHVREALRSHEFAMAERQLMKAGTITADDPAFLNLAGVLHECHGRVDSARKFYERSAARDRKYRPASENLRRLGELRRWGKTSRKVAFGDDDVGDEDETLIDAEHAQSGAES